jgi:opacity protein-like surface antigen
MTTKTIVSATFVASVGFAGVTSAQVTPAQSMYFRAETGYSWSRDADIRDRDFAASPAICGDAGCTTPGNIDDVGRSWLFGGAIGYRVNPNVRGELALGYRGSYGFGQTMPNGATLNADVASWNVMANGYYDFDVGAPVRPYLSAGLGWARNRVSQVNSVDPAGAAAGGSQDNLAWSLGAGIAYPMNNRLTLDFGYRYVDLGRFDTSAGAATLTGAAAPYAGATGKLRVNELVVGVRW